MKYYRPNHEATKTGHNFHSATDMKNHKKEGYVNCIIGGKMPVKNQVREKNVRTMKYGRRQLKAMRINYGN